MRLILLLEYYLLILYTQIIKIICELSGSYLLQRHQKTYLSEGIEFFKNLAQQTQQSLFLLQKQKLVLHKRTGKKIIFISSNTEIDDQDNLVSMKHTLSLLNLAKPRLLGLPKNLTLV